VTSDSQLSEVEAVLAKVTDARERAAYGAAALELAAAPAHLVTALRRTEIQLGEDHRHLAQATLFAVNGDNVPV